MKLRFVALLSAVALIGAAGAPAAFAGQVTWNFYALTGMPAAPGSATWSTSSSTHTTASPSADFTQNGLGLYAIAATSVGCSGGFSGSAWCPGSGDLYSKNAGTGEQGLGLTNDTYNNNEISNPYGIYLYIGQGSFSSVQLGSVQAGETWSVWGSTNASGTSWTELGSGTGGGIVNFDLTGYNQIVIGDPYLANQSTGTSNNIVLMSVTTVPEPGTLALLAVGLAAIGFAVKRRRKLRADA